MSIDALVPWQALVEMMLAFYNYIIVVNSYFRQTAPLMMQFLTKYVGSRVIRFSLEQN